MTNLKCLIVLTESSVAAPVIQLTMGASGPSNEESKGDLDCIVAPPPGWKADCTGQMNASNRPPRRLPVGGSSTCDKGPDFLVPTTKTPAARPHKVARNVMTPQTSIKSIAIVTDDAPQFILRRRRTLPSTEHMIGHRVRSNVADEVAERTARSHNDRYQFRAPSSFSNSKLPYCIASILYFSFRQSYKPSLSF